MISLATFGLNLFVSRPDYLQDKKASLGLLANRWTGAMCMVTLYGEKMFSIQSWHWWKYSYLFCWRQNLWLVVFLCVLFFASYFSLLLRHHPELRYFYSGEVYSWNQIRVLPSGNVVIIILQYHLLLLQYFFIIQDTLELFIREFSLHWDRYHWVIFYHSSLNSGKMFGCIGMPHSE